MRHNNLYTSSQAPSPPFKKHPVKSFRCINSDFIMFTEVELPVNILTMLAQELKSSSNNQIVKNGIKPPYANANHIDQQTWI